MRFKLRTPFFDYARDQVKGGIWYRPTWWDAVSNVPPVHFQPRIKKREVPAITFLEDSLVRCVCARLAVPLHAGALLAHPVTSTAKTPTPM